MKDKSVIKKFYDILSEKQKKELYILTVFLFFGMLFEIFGLGLLMPSLGVLLDSNLAMSYPSMIPLLNKLGNPNQKKLILIVFSFLTIYYLVKTIYLVNLSYRQSKFSTNLSSNIAKRLFEGYMKQSYEFHLNKHSGILIRNINNEVSQITFVSQAIISFSIELTIILGVCVVLFFIEPIASITVLFFLTILVFAFYFTTKKKLASWGDIRQASSGNMNKQLLQGIGGIKEAKLSNTENYFIKEFNKYNTEHKLVMTKVNTLTLVPRIYLEFLSIVGLTIIVFLMILQGQPVSHLIPILGIFVAAAFRMMPSFNRVMNAMQQFKFANATINMLHGEFQLFGKSDIIMSNSKIFTFNNVIDVKNISYSYPEANKNVLNKINFSINKGDSIGIIGESGAGKSTLVDIILGLFSPSSGVIQVDDRNIQSNLKGWQKNIGYVPQTCYLIDDSIRNNIAFGIPDANIDENAILKAIKAANLFEFISKLDDGLNTHVGERGVRLSGGQRQRIAIARALYNDPEILILDEATSALDTNTEREVMQSINNLQGVKTLIIIAHRLSTIEKCNKIIQLKDGYLINNKIN